MPDGAELYAQYHATAQWIYVAMYNFLAGFTAAGQYPEGARQFIKHPG